MKEVKIEKMQEIELPKIDYTRHIGKKATIESVRTYESEYMGKPTLSLEVKTSVIEIVQNTDGEDVELRAGVRVGLQTDKDGKVGWGKDTKCGKFLLSMNVKHPDELIGKNVTVQLTEPNKDGRRFLTFTA